tara:strand:+ start:139 stop:528 length:390 start_codon:yes stop_codon:yes gene_type:complete
MRKYIIYALDTGVIKSVVTTSGDPKNDAPDGYDYIECCDPTEGMAVDVNAKALVPSEIELPFVLSNEGKRKRKRNALLEASDWTQFSDSPLTSTKKSQWATYRQALRDLPQSHSKAESLDDIIWPIQPE